MASATFSTLRRDLAFALYDLWHVDQLCERPAFEQHSRDSFDAMLETAVRMAAEHFEPHAAIADQREPSWDGERVFLPDEVKVALDEFIAGGFIAASFGEEDGGLGLPYSMAQAFMAAFYAANPSTAAYPLLTAAAANLLRAFASDEQKARFLGPMLEGRFFGTMCLSEPHAGSSLADLRCSAEPQSDGTYHVVGDKMWISGGEHELSETIVHLVLARLPDAPAGTRGISLFIVPRHHVDEAGKVGAPNGVRLIGLNHKMGYRGTVNTALAFGTEEPAVGYLVGEPHQGLRYMFHMMNEARVGVGLGATMLGYAGYRHSLEYAKERTQGRAPDMRDPSSPPLPIIEHADVRRMLLAQKALSEGGLALAIYCARLIDEQATATDDDERQRADDLLQILTPIAKAWPSEHGPRANDLAIQVLGGYGYTRDFPVERFYRDNRLNPIHEGTNGVQSLDLLGRKVTMNGGRAFFALARTMRDAVARCRAAAAGDAFIDELGRALEAVVARVERTTGALGQVAAAGQVRLFLANSYEYLLMLGHTVIAWMWLEQAAVAQAQLGAGASGERADFLRGKLAAARFFFRHELPRTERQAALLESLDDTTLSCETSWL